MYLSQTQFDFIEEQNRELLSSFCDSCNSEKSWCNPAAYKEIIGVDFGSGYAFVYFLHEDKLEKIKYCNFISFVSSLPENVLIVVEQAHLGVPQSEKSLAQPFTKEQLQHIYRTCDEKKISLKLFPHDHSRKAREWAALNNETIELEKTSDENDAKAIAWFVAHNNSISLANPPSDFEAKAFHVYSQNVIRESNRTLNIVRVQGYDGQVFPGIERIAESTFRKLGLDGGFVNKKIAFSVASMMLKEIDQNIFAFSYNEKVPGWNFFSKHVLKMTPFHTRGSIARSNICWHRFRPAFADYAKSVGLKIKSNQKYKRFSEFTKEEEMCRRKFWKIVRSELRSAYRFIEEEINRGIDLIELLKQ